MKQMKRIATGVASLTMAVSLAMAMPIGVRAAGTSYTAGLTTAVNGSSESVSKNTTTFDKYLVMDVNANVPNATFNFSIAPYTNATEGSVITAASGGNLAVLNGVTAESSSGTLNFKADDATNTSSATAGEVKFASADTTVTEGTQGADTAVKWSDNTSGNEKYAKKTLTLDFSTVQFTEPGVYRYLITETGTNQGITNDTGVTGDNNCYRTLDVYVQDYTDYYNNLSAEDTINYTAPSGKELFIAGYVLYEGKHDTAPSATAETATVKSTSYTNAYATHDLTFGKEVTGNQGSKDKYFDFTVAITGATAGTVYTVDLSNADATSGTNAATISENQNKTNVASITIGNDGTATTHFYLQDGQYITILGLAEGTKYAITENYEDYTQTAGITADLSTLNWDGTAGNDALSDATSNTTGITADVHTGFTNTRSGVIPTGVLLSVAAPAGVGVVVIGGIAYLLAKDKRRKEEEE